MNIVYTTQFKKDFKKLVSQEKDTSKFEIILDLLLDGKKLPQKYKDHPLTGNWKNHRDCHIEPDWILIYRITDDTLFLERTGSHSQLFK